MAVVPADKELNLKALAAASGNHKVRLVPVKDLEKLTGYVRGESRHLALRKHTQSMLMKLSINSIVSRFHREFVECRFSSRLQIM
jgi:Cys-tRNA(Pro)/Cys-tRNA(Cys) deacylase